MARALLGRISCRYRELWHGCRVQRLGRHGERRAIPPVPPPAEEDDTSSMVDNLLRCGGSEAGQTYDEVVTSPQKPTDPAIPAEALYDEILSLREQVARMEAGGAFALQDELDRLRRRLDTADGDLGAPLPPPEDAPLRVRRDRRPR